MHCIRKVTDDLLWIGASDRQHPHFEAVLPIPNGMSFNSYLLLDEKTVLFDTVDRAVQGQFFENLEYSLKGRALDYVFVHHMRQGPHQLAQKSSSTGRSLSVTSFW